MPSGMVKLSPDNQDRGWKAGYDYTINNIAGFSHIHSWTMAGVLMQPVTGELQIKPGTEKEPWRGYRSRFSHDREQASPGHYSVYLDDYDVKAELSSTKRVGYHRYTFPEAFRAKVLIDLVIDSEYGYELSNGRAWKVSDQEIAGWTYQTSLRNAYYNDYQLHFVVRFNKPFNTFNGWVKENIKRNVEEISAGWGHKDFGLFVEFNTEKDEKVKAQVGISLVSVEQARLNLEKETQPFGWDFDAVVQHNQDTWNDLLSRIEVETDVKSDKTKFYTNLYRAYSARTVWSDVNGKYRDMYENVQQVPDPQSPVYGSDAFWNTFWNLNSLWNLLTPDYSAKWVRSLLEIYDKGGWLPKGPTGIEYSGIMVASHSIPFIVSAYQAGIRDFDVDKALEAMIHQQTTPGLRHEGGGFAGNRNLEEYMELGYVPNEEGPVSNTLEYAFDDWCVSEFADALGEEDVRQRFEKRARNFENVFDPSVKYVRMKKSNGEWVQPFDSLCCSTFRGSGYVEGNAWQYTWFVPHDVSWIVDFLGKETFNDRLVRGFKKSKPWKFSAERVNYDQSLHSMGVLPINHGNQPNMQAAYLFNYSGKPWLTQKWARSIMEEYYGLGPETGWPGDEDQGQMGAWFVNSSMGLFQMKGGASTEPVWEIGSPLFDRVTIHLDKGYYSGEKFVIETVNNSKENIYIRKAFLNGEKLEKPWIYHEDIVGGGRLKLIMSDKPNKDWGSSLEDAPPAMSDKKNP